MSPGRDFFITAWIKTLERIPAYTGILLLISFIVNESCGDRQITQEHGGEICFLYLFVFISFTCATDKN